jgi:hypothetical protein
MSSSSAQPTKGEIFILIPLGLALLASLAFMFSGKKQETPAKHPAHELAWVRPFLTNLQAGGVNDMTVQSLRASKATVVPLLVSEMNVRPPTMGKTVSENIEKLLSRYTAYRAQVNVSDGYRAAAADALQSMFRDRATGAYHAASVEEAGLLLPVLGNALYDNALMVRVHAAGTLGAFTNSATDALELCRIALVDHHWLVRANAMNSLGTLVKVQPAAVDLVKAGLKDSHQEVRRSAVAVFERAGFAVPEEVRKSIPQALAYGFE